MACVKLLCSVLRTIDKICFFTLDLRFFKDFSKLIIKIINKYIISKLELVAHFNRSNFSLFFKFENKLEESWNNYQIFQTIQRIFTLHFLRSSAMWRNNWNWKREISVSKYKSYSLQPHNNTYWFVMCY